MAHIVTNLQIYMQVRIGMAQRTRHKQHCASMFCICLYCTDCVCCTDLMLQVDVIETQFSLLEENIAASQVSQTHCWHTQL